MVFLSQKIRRKFAGSPTIVVLTDREELNTQISDTFETVSYTHLDVYKRQIYNRGVPGRI